MSIIPSFYFLMTKIVGVTKIFFQIQKSVSSRLQVNMKLEQDEMEGVDEKEWEE